MKIDTEETKVEEIINSGEEEDDQEISFEIEAVKPEDFEIYKQEVT